MVIAEQVVAIVRRTTNGEFLPEYLLETEPNATSIVKCWWRLDNWSLSKELVHEQIGPWLFDKPKVKYFVIESYVTIYCNEPVKGYFRDWCSDIRDST